MARRLSAWSVISKAGALTLIIEAFGQASSQAPDRLLGIITVIAIGLARYQDMQTMMDVIIPLGVV